jgi:CDP-diacylglycerol pyrophosphatase
MRYRQSGGLHPRYWRPWFLVPTVIAITVTAITMAKAADPDALWKHVVEVCLKSDPATDASNPCDVVAPQKDYLLVKDICGPTQYLLLPTDRLSGIESEELAAAPNYFQLAWAQRDWVSRRAGRPLAPDEIALALNSADRRSQNQLHIHIDLARAGLSTALATHQNDPLGRWSSFRFQDHDYHLMRLGDLASQDPIRLVRARVAAAQEMMRHQTIGLVGARFADGSSGFYLLNGGYDGTPNGGGWAEELEIDHPKSDCGYHRAAMP